MSVKQGIGLFINPYLSHKSTEKKPSQGIAIHTEIAINYHTTENAVYPTFIAGNIARVHVVALYKLSFALFTYLFK